MSGVEASQSELRERLTAIVRSTPALMQVLSVSRRLCLPDWLVFSGAVYQPVLSSTLPVHLRRSGSHRTRPWREVDSNFRFPNRSASVFEKAVPSPMMV